MSQGEDMGDFDGPNTARGRDYPSIRQFTVFLENRVGMLASLTRRFVGTRVRVLSLGIVDSTEGSIVRMVFSHPEQGREILIQAGFSIVETDLLAVELSNVAQPLLEVFSTLLQGEVNLVQTCTLIIPNHSSTILGIMVDNIDLASDILMTNDFNLLSEFDLQDLA